MTNTVYLARRVPRMCLPMDHPNYEFSRPEAYESYPIHLPPKDDIIVEVRGRDLRAEYPIVDRMLSELYSFDPIRPAASYVIVSHQPMTEDGEIVDEPSMDEIYEVSPA